VATPAALARKVREVLEARAAAREAVESAEPVAG